MRIVIDTNRYVDFAKGDAEALNVIRQADQIWLTYITLGELRAGFLCGNRSADNEKNLIRFLDSSRVDILYADENTTHLYARIFMQLRQQGTPIPTNDLWIAALTLQHNLSIFARDRHFDHIPQLPRAG